MALSPFDFLKSINETKEDLIVDEQTEKEYSPYMINRGLSFFIDTVLYANEMNLNYHLDHKAQYFYYINIIRSRKRFSKWFKKKDDDDLNAVMQYYGYSINKARSALSILSVEQIKTIKEMLRDKNE